MTTAVTIAPPPILAFLDNNGRPCSGGSVLTQVGGINTATYQDSAGTIQLPNPIPLNNRGEISNASGISCQLFLATGVAYTFTLFDAQGNQLNQASYVATSNSLVTFIATLLSSIGSSLIGFIQAGVGAVSRTSQSKMREWRSVYDYGAGGAGVTDDTAFIQSTIDANLNGTGLMPEGAFNITDTLHIKYDNGTGKNCVNLLGMGLGTTLLWNGGDNKPMIWIEGTSANAGTFSKTLIEKLFIKNQVSAAGFTGIRIGNIGGALGMQGGVSNVTIRNVKIDAAAIGIESQYESDGLNVEDCVISNYTSIGFYNHGSARVNVSKNYFQFGTTGSLAVHCEYSTVSVVDNLIQSSATGVVGAIKLLNCNSWRIEANYMEFAQTGAQFAILLSNSRDGYIGGNPIQGFRGADCIYIDATSGNVDVGPNSYGFFTAAPNSLIRAIAGASNINILGTQSFTGGAPPGTPFLGAGFNFAVDTNTIALGQSAYTATPNSGVTVNASGVLNIGNTAGTAGWGFQSFCRSGVSIGSITQTGTTGVAYNTTSDQDLKDDLGVCEGSDVIRLTRVHDFTWRSDGAVDRGVFAQEAHLVKPGAVRVGTDEVNANGQKVSPWGVDYSKYVPDLIVESQAQLRLIEQLQADVAALKAPQ